MHKIIALAGNPNVGKSTLFNELTGLHQHTGNWPGKTVSVAEGSFCSESFSCTLVDLPGAYSLCPHSAEEEITSEFLRGNRADAVIVVCDATCLEHNLLLALQIRFFCPKMLLCINLMDEASKKGVRIDTKRLETILQLPVAAISARSHEGLDILLKKLDGLLNTENPTVPQPLRTSCTPASAQEAPHAEEKMPEILSSENAAEEVLLENLAQEAAGLCAEALDFQDKDYRRRDRVLDRFLTGKFTGSLSMLLLLALIFWITAAGANYPSALLSSLFRSLEPALSEICLSLPPALSDLLINGIYRMLTWVVSVMLPPMAIFFPLFTLLEDAGYLPRIAYNLDSCFQKCKACGKQALTMAMGFGCNCVGVLGCRIIDSPRERMIALLTNSFVPCNGRFPTLIALLSLCAASSFHAALLLTCFILLSVLMTFAASRLLSATILKGVPSSFTLELPPYRRPQLGKVILRSLLDRTLFVLGRAVSVAIPAGALIWITANITISTSSGSISILAALADFLNPFAALLGLDGVILLAFFLGMPANETVLPIMLMAYLGTGSLVEVSDSHTLGALLAENGWTLKTAVCTCLFTLFHWPCTTTLLSIKHETKSLKWTAAAFLLPTLFGMAVCMATSAVFHLFSYFP